MIFNTFLFFFPLSHFRICNAAAAASARCRSQLYESTPGELIRRLNALAEEKVERVQQFFAKSQGDVLEVEWTDFLFSEASKYGGAFSCD